MADHVPQALKQADITLYKTATRAAQLQSVKPIISYWCEYWVVNQILARNLHNTDAEILNYTTTLMDRLEQIKNEYAAEDAVSDDAAAQAYVEQFAQETLDRAERVIKAGKVTQQTASTFDAALTFFNLVNVWGPPDTETQQKIKYAKWNAARITKAIKEGRDPNESNPKKEDLPQQQAALDPTDPEVQALGSPSGQLPRSATVEDAPDPDLPGGSAAVSLPHSPTAPSLPSVPADDGELKLPSAPGYGDQADSSPQPGYFDPPPSLPSPVSPPGHNPVNSTPSAPFVPPTWTPTPPPAAPSFKAPPPPAVGPPPSADVSRPVISPPTTLGSSSAAPTAPGDFSRVPQQVTVSFAADDAAMAQAQKHAKWAISALNFEDVTTAVRELRRALETLGAT